MAARRYGVELRPVDPISESTEDGVPSTYSLISAYALTDFDRILAIETPGLLLDASPLDAVLAQHSAWLGWGLTVAGLLVLGSLPALVGLIFALFGVGMTLLTHNGIFDVIGTIGSGWLTDRYDPRILLALYYATRGLSLLFVNDLLGPTTDVPLWVFVVFYGLDWTATVPPTV